jgi:hypothetical protein
MNAHTGRAKSAYLTLLLRLWNLPVVLELDNQNATEAEKPTVGAASPTEITHSPIHPPL